MGSGFSGPDGFFRSDNFVSKESTFQQVIPELTRRTKPGGVYIGVGPDQNFTYIAALKPKLGFIIDTRRQNLIEHLMYKAVMDLSANRPEFLSMLFSRPLPQDLAPDVQPQELFEAFGKIASSDVLFHSNLDRIEKQLIEVHRFKLDAGDLH